MKRHLFILDQSYQVLQNDSNILYYAIRPFKEQITSRGPYRDMADKIFRELRFKIRERADFELMENYTLELNRQLIGLADRLSWNAPPMLSIAVEYTSYMQSR